MTQQPRPPRRREVSAIRARKKRDSTASARSASRGRAAPTLLEVRRGERLRLRITASADVLAEAGDELGALVRKVTSATAEASVSPGTVDFEISRSHADSDDAYHASLREHLATLLNSLCDTALADALQIAREIHGRRTAGTN